MPKPESKMFWSLLSQPAVSCPVFAWSATPAHVRLQRTEQHRNSDLLLKGPALPTACSLHTLNFLTQIASQSDQEFKTHQPSLMRAPFPKNFKAHRAMVLVKLNSEVSFKSPDCLHKCKKNLMKSFFRHCIYILHRFFLR